MDINDIRGISTLLALAAFVAVWAWAWSKSASRGFNDAANQLFNEDEESMHQQSLKEMKQ